MLANILTWVEGEGFQIGGYPCKGLRMIFFGVVGGDGGIYIANIQEVGEVELTVSLCLLRSNSEVYTQLYICWCLRGSGALIDGLVQG